jgi:hypothetical protein
MSDTSKLMLSREQLAAFLSDPDAIRKFERLFTIVDGAQGAVSVTNLYQTASVLYIEFSNGLWFMWETVVKSIDITHALGALFYAADVWVMTHPPTAYNFYYVTANYETTTPDRIWSEMYYAPNNFTIFSPVSKAAQDVICKYFAIGYIP